MEGEQFIHLLASMVDENETWYNRDWLEYK